MTLEDIRKLVVASNSPESLEDSMVYMVWEDGEITVTKGGPLLWQRTLHMVRSGYAAPEDRAKAVRECMSGRYNSYGFIPVATREIAQELADLIGLYFES
jgi:hypothetical protein